jgi:redox-sensitive bicupin YhaK (pirin superfamily)
MWELRKSGDRGYADHGWLQSRHTFSFADYFDPNHVEFGVLRVINEDRVAPGKGFGTHGHRDMEIVTYVLDGKLAHKDSMGTGSVIVPGDVQRMSAGSGVTHSEMNASPTEPVHFLQIWIRPSVAGIPPSYEQKHFARAEKRGRLRLVAAPDSIDGAVLLHQDVRLYAGLFDGAEHATLRVGKGRRAYVHLARGSLSANGTLLEAGDAVRTEGVDALKFSAGTGAEVLVFELPGDASGEVISPAADID